MIDVKGNVEEAYLGVLTIRGENVAILGDCDPQALKEIKPKENEHLDFEIDG